MIDDGHFCIWSLEPDVLLSTLVYDIALSDLPHRK